MYKLNIPQFNQDIYIWDAWRIGNKIDSINPAEPPRLLNVYDLVKQYRGTTDYSSGYVDFLKPTPNNVLKYRITYTAATDTGTIDFVRDNDEAHGLRFKFNFGLGVEYHMKFLCFIQTKNAYVDGYSYDGPSTPHLLLCQAGGTGSVVVWDARPDGTVTETLPQLEFTDYYNARGPWSPIFPQVAGEVPTDILPATTVCFYREADKWHLSIDEQSHRAYVDSFFGESWSPADITNTSGQGPEYNPDPNEEDNPPYGPGHGGDGGGTGAHNLPDENIPVPSLPAIGAASVSWLHLFKMSESDISAFGNDLVQATNWEAIQAFFSDPLDAIIGINLVPVDMPTSGQRTPVIGNFSWSRAFDVVSEEFYELDCGEVDIDPYWDSAFDMNPFTKIFIYLPFIGTRELNADEVMGTTLGVIYHVDVCTGDCTAFVTKKAQDNPVYGPIKDQVIAQFNGNCAVRVPTGRISQDAAIGAAMSLLGQAAHVGGAIAGAAFGAPETIAAAQVATQVSSATMHAVNGGKTKVERSGSLAAAAGYMGILKPYIIRAIPQQVLPTNYQMLEGYPANKAASLSQFSGSGLNTVEAIQLRGFTGYDSEQDELISILQGGVLV